MDIMSMSSQEFFLYKLGKEIKNMRDICSTINKKDTAECKTCLSNVKERMDDYLTAMSYLGYDFDEDDLESHIAVVQSNKQPENFRDVMSELNLSVVSL